MFLRIKTTLLLGVKKSFSVIEGEKQNNSPRGHQLLKLPFCNRSYHSVIISTHLEIPKMGALLQFKTFCARA